jgi:hypothetical protein
VEQNSRVVASLSRLSDRITHAGETVLDTDLPLYRSNSRILADMIINRASMNPSLIQPVKPEFEEEKNQILDVIYGDIVAKMF